MTIEIPVPFVTHKLDKPPSQTVETSKSARPAPRWRRTPCHARGCAGWRLAAPRSRLLHLRAALMRALARPTHQVKS